MVVKCIKCDEEAPTFTSLNDHNRELHNNEPFECPICGRHIQLAHNMALHLLKCQSHRLPFCSICRKTFNDVQAVRDHTKNVHTHGLPKGCKICKEKFQSVSELDAHTFSKHTNGTISELPKPDSVTFDDSRIEVEDVLRKLYQRYWSAIRTSYKFDILVNVYNFRVEGSDHEILTPLIKLVYLHQQGIFKINLSVGLILQHNPTGTFRYYHAGLNNLLLNEPRRIASRRDLHSFISDINEIDLNQHGALSRPDTTHAVYAIANVMIKTFHSINSVPIGTPGNTDIRMIQLLKNNNHILCMEKDKHGRTYKDNLCFFRCLSSEVTKMKYPCEKNVSLLFDRWLNFKSECGDIVTRDFSTFPGVRMSDLADLEDCFKCNINVYTLTFEQDPHGYPVAKTLFRSTKLYKCTLFLNCFQKHFSRITSINHYARSWICGECGSIIDTQRLYALHIRKCQGQVRNVFPGGGFSQPKTVFEKLADEGFTEQDHYYPYYIVFDFESMFRTLGSNELCGQSLVYEKELVPISVSICSNVPGFTVAKCIISQSPEDLVEEFLENLIEIAETAYHLVNQKFLHITETIAEKTDMLVDVSRSKKNRKTDWDDMETEQRKHSLQNWEKLEEEWDAWLRKTPVVGFNSSRFDLNLIRRFLIPALIKKFGCIDSSITKGSTYITIVAGNLVFLDVANFLAAGTSYSKWLKGFGIAESKGLFPYEWLTSFDKLYQTELPTRDDFYSTLKQSSISEADYSYLQSVWDKNSFENMFDFLTWYNNLDITPFITALESMRRIFQSMDIDFLKQGCVSLPGLAMTHMFKSVRPDIIFQLYDDSTKDYHALVHKNIVGGPSIIFNRYTVVEAGKIKKTGPIPKSIEGHDCNGLYLSTLKKPMPTGFAAIWETNDHATFKDIPTSNHGCHFSELATVINCNRKQVFHKRQSGSGFDELLFVCFTYNNLQATSNKKLSLQHKWNGGQKAFHVEGSTLPVDGWVPELGIIIQYHGCYFHGHSCQLTKSSDRDHLQERAQNTKRIKKLLEQTGNKVIYVYECEFQRQKESQPELKQYVRTMRLKSTHPPRLSMGDILDLVVKEKFFGMIELDIQVPFWRLDLREKMKEFPPIFKNCEISIDDIGKTMSAYALKHGLMHKPRRCLISSYFGNKILLPTPLIKWYIENGLVVTKIYRAIEYTPIEAFAHLVDEVTEHRKAADKNSSFQSYGETFKLLGNSYYGRCLTNILKHKKIRYGNRLDAARAVNSSRFRSLERIGSGIYEIHTAKPVNCFKLPINIGFFVYGYSKLRMLEFYYGFLCKVMPFDHFELLEMDTDSLYFSLAGKTLEETVSPTQRLIFEKLKHEFLVTDDDSKRTTGLFKLEWSGTTMICTAPKSYIAFSHESTKSGTAALTNVKLSTKGVSKVVNQLTAADFEAALLRQEEIEGTNKGFRMKGGHLYQYTQKRRALSFLYIKRLVEEDGVHTEPLNL